MAFGTYPTLVNSTSAGAKGEIAALFATLKLLIPDGTANPPPNAAGVGSHTVAAPDFGEMSPYLANLLRAEIDAAALAVSAGP